METSRVTSLPELVATIPYVVGYHPSDALVAVCMRGSRIKGAVVWRESASVLAADRALLRGHVRAAVAAGTDTVMLVAVDAVDGRERIDVLSAAFIDSGVSVHTRAVVSDGRVTDLDAGVAAPLVQDAPLDVAASYAARGVSPLSSREEIVEAFEARGTETVTVALAQDGRALTAAVQAWGRILEPHGEAVAALPAQVLAMAASALLETGTRDALIGRIVPGVGALGVDLETGASDAVLALPATREGDEVAVAERLRAMATRLSDDDATPTLTVAATLYWAAGDGARADIALERALRAHPAYTLACLTRRLVDTGIPMRAMAPLA